MNKKTMKENNWAIIDNSGITSPLYNSKKNKTLKDLKLIEIHKSWQD